ncbi:hypothetical protein Bbelb_339070 [Branchiostoma belcheri]|nr:hypothetical protein Bbelb_339070 [Branchiostoma belcheri]
MGSKSLYPRIRCLIVSLKTNLRKEGTRLSVDRKTSLYNTRLKRGRVLNVLKGFQTASRYGNVCFKLTLIDQQNDVPYPQTGSHHEPWHLQLRADTQISVSSTFIAFS